MFSSCTDDSSQQWSYESNSMRFKHVDSNRCLDVQKRNKNRLIISNCHSGSNQKFMEIQQKLF